MSDDDHDQDYKVGKNNPPKDTQWKKGQSGNPSGKKKKEETLQEILRRLAGQEIVVQKNGVQMSMTQGEAMLTAVFAKAMNGDITCARFVKAELGIDMAPSGLATPTLQMSDADIACLTSHSDWVKIIEAAQAECDPGDDGGTNDADAPE